MKGFLVEEFSDFSLNRVVQVCKIIEFDKIRSIMIKSWLLMATYILRKIAERRDFRLSVIFQLAN